MNQNLSFGQRVDDSVGLVECWFTHGALDWIKQQDWSDKVVWMFGAGLGDAWLAKRCKWLHVVERNNDWVLSSSTNCANNNCNNVTYYYRPCNDCTGMDEMYCYIPQEILPDVIINDDAYRYEVIKTALSLTRPLVLITDNWQQDYVFICPSAEVALQDYERIIFEQQDHKDHEGNRWKTAIFFIK